MAVSKAANDAFMAPRRAHTGAAAESHELRRTKAGGGGRRSDADGASPGAGSGL